MFSDNPLIQGFLSGLRLPTQQSLTEWAEENRYMAAATTAQPGPYRCGDATFQRGMQDALLEPGVEQVIAMTSSQVGKTTFLLNGMLYFAAEEPSPQLVGLPKDDAAEAFAVDFFEKTVEASPKIAPLFKRSKTNKQKTQHKQYPGGQITFVGANVPANLAMRPIRCVWGDEIDRWPRSAGQEGDPVNLVIKRTTTFANRKIVLVSTPTLKEGSRIAHLYAQTDQRRFFVCCPECQHEQTLRFERVIYDKGREDKAEYSCEECGALWSERAKRQAVAKGRWKATAVGTPGMVGFHISELYSPWSTMAKIARAWESARGKPAEEQTFLNTVLGETYDGDVSSQADTASLQARREKLPVDGLPLGIGLITAGVDMQADRLEVQVVGWGLEDESWLLAHDKLYGDTSVQTVWRDLEQYLGRRYLRQGGQYLDIEGVAIDSGYGAQRVYDFVDRNTKLGRRWYAIKGMPGERRPIWQRSEQRIRTGLKLFLVGVDDAKTTFYQHAAIAAPGPGYVHIPDYITDEVLAQITSERAKVHYIDGFPKRVWEKQPGARNEALDCRVYAYAVQRSLNIDIAARLRRWAAEKPAALNPAAVGALFR